MRCWDGARVHRRGQDWPDAEGKADGEGSGGSCCQQGVELGGSAQTVEGDSDRLASYHPLMI